MHRWGHRLTHDTIGRTRHTLGTTPLGGVQLPPSRVLIIDERADGTFLTRYTERGAFAGDTWHETTEDALDQAAFEFGVSKGEWVEIPDDQPDALAYLAGDE